MSAPRNTLLLAGTAAASGCAECGSVEEIEGVYAMFANVVEYDGNNLEKFPAETSPANGASEWSIIVDSSAITVFIDDATFPASAEVSTVECGRFSLAFSGAYESGDDVHVLTTAGEYLIVGDHLEGTWDYEEDWTSKKDSGSFEATGNVYGTRIGEPFSE